MNELVNRIKNDIVRVKVLRFEEEEVLCDSKFINLTRGKYYLNNNMVIEREVITTKIGTGHAVCIFAVTSDNNILLVIQPRVVLKNNDGINIEIPAGYIEDGEASVDTALRELKEETGYVTDNIIKLDEYHTSIGFSDAVMELFLAVDCKKMLDQSLDNDEAIIVETVDMDEFEYLLNNNYIFDVNTKMGYYRYLNYLKRGNVDD